LFAHHPSPLAANRGGWFGCKHFSLTNHWLTLQGLNPIQWSNIV
jgi:uracil-DNA glycosylase